MNNEAMSRSALLLVGCAYLGAVLLHVDRAPVWCSVAALLALVWRGATLLRGVALPGRMVRIVLTLALAAVTLLAFRTLNGLAAGSALLISMGAAKLLETRARRDALVVVAVAMILLLAACLDSQSMPRVPFYALQAWLGCAAFAALGGSAATRSPRLALRTAGRALLLSLPFALLAFAFFPRLPGALWPLPGNDRATTGLGDEMSPGSISELSISDAPAFRVRFAGPLPAAADRYWRGPVLHEFDGYTWRRGRQFAPVQALQLLGEPVRYRLTLEPHGRNWWYALDTVSESPRRGVTVSFDRQLLSNRPVDAVISYDAVSYTRTRSEDTLSLTAQRMDGRLPEGRNPRSRQLAQQLRAAAPDERAFAAAVLDYFRQAGFEYSLTPPLLDYDSVDDLIFNTRLGFCGHFASAYASLMRAGGVPARVVTGYLGGEWNPLGEYFIVRQSDAHAWVEIWLQGQGWTRVDPTAVVAPERLTRGLRDLLPDSGSAAARFARRSPLLNDLLQFWDASNTWWRDNVVEFNLASQVGLLERLGLHEPDYRELVGALAGGAAIWIAWLTWQLRRQRGPAKDPLAVVWGSLRKRLARAGVPLYAHEGPLQLATRAGHEFPALAVQLQAAALTYATLRYGPPSQLAQQQLAGLKQQVRALELPLRRRLQVQQLPDADAAMHAELASLLPLYRRMPEPLRRRCAAVAADFLRGVRMVGCGGLEVTDTMRRVIAFQAALLVVNRGMDLYRGLHAVLVYPDEFVVTQTVEDDAGVITEGSDVLSGQTVDTARVLVSWADVLAGIAAADGYNVVLHEFAHLLDAQVGGEAWHAQLADEYQRLCDAVDAGLDTLMDPYGAEDPAEFFAVCTEHYFEQPGALQQQHPQLYASLLQFYGTDPARW